MEFSSVTVSFLVHSTENGDRLFRQVESRFDLGSNDLAKENMTGHFGNQLISVKAHIIGQRVQEVARKIVQSLSNSSKAIIVSEIEKSLDEHDSLFLRIDRQTLDEASLALSDDEPIRVKLKPRTRYGGRQSMKSQYEELLK